MSHTLSRLCLAAVATILGASACTLAQPEAPAYLRCEYLREPMCVESPKPRFCWEVRDERRGALQSAYEIHVSTTRDGTTDGVPDVWTSGRVASNQSCQIEYAGPALKSAARYYWTVRTWDAGGKSSPWSETTSFSMGLLSPSDWQAKWIGDATPAPAPIPANNGYHSTFSENHEAEKWITIDLGEVKDVDGVTLWPARPYDGPGGADLPGFCFPMRYLIQTAEDAGFAAPRVLVDKAGVEQDKPGTSPVVLTFPPEKVRYVRLLAFHLRNATPTSFALAFAEMQVLSGGKVLSQGATATSNSSLESGAWGIKRLTDGDTVSHGVKGWDALPAPMLRKQFSLANEVRRATLFISALGVYEARLNGTRVGDQELAPEWTDYFTRVQYQAYDVTAQLKRGPNAIGVMLGDGWYAGRLGMAQGFTPDRRPRAVYGRQPRLLAQLRIESNDGTVQTIASDGSWTSNLDGPVRVSDTLDGETYDARRAIPGWDNVAADGKIAGSWQPVVVDDKVKIAIVAQPNEPIRQIQTIKPIGMTEPKPGHFVFDLGQNMPGWCRIRVKGKAGAVVTLRHVEAVNDDGTIYTPNLRGAPQIDRYTLSGDPAGETWAPRFTYHGFRFVELTGDIERPTLESLEGIVVCSAPPIVSSFDCSNKMLNKLWSNILWTQHANMMSVPTDCPQRDERLGWMGDILAFAQNAAFNKDMGAFYEKFSLDIRDSQANDGRFPDVAPHPYGKNERFTGVPAWGDAGVFVPWTSYLNYGDTRLLAEHFDASKRWVDWIYSKNADYLWRNNRHNDYNDWLNGDTLIQEGWPKKGGSIPNEIFATAFFARSTWIVSEMARVLGRDAEQKKYADLHANIKAAFIKNFVGDGAVMPGATQAGYALALAFDLLPADKRDGAVANLVAGIQQYKGHLSTGFHSTHHAMIELTEAGHTELAHQLAANTSFPSWGYSIENGATTIWERWDGYVKGRGFQDPGMNSLNHWALGSVGEWMMRTILGINPDPAAPGWSRVVIAPKPGGGLTHAKGNFRSPRGLIESAWKVQGGTTLYEITVPPNTAAQIRLAAASANDITESNKPLAQSEGVKVAGAEPARATDAPIVILEVGAGRYSFRVTK